MSPPAPAYDAVLLLSFGGPEGPDDVIPFLENVTRGRGVPAERLAEVARQYQRVGGVSPINAQNRALLDALRRELDRRGRDDLPLYWGNRNWAPYVEDVMADITRHGHRRVLALATSAYSSYSGCRQYLDDIERARAHVGDAAPPVDKVRPYWNHPGFVLAMSDRVNDACAGVGPAQLARARLVFTAHSIPVSMAATSDYEAQLRDVVAMVTDRLSVELPADLVYQSRSGPPHVPWLEPDIVDHLERLHDAGTGTVVVAPIGFISDHMEVVHDLDTLAADAARELGMTMIRAGTVGTHPRFAQGLVDLLEEYLVGAAPQSLGELGPRRSPCQTGCCPAPRRPDRTTPAAPG